MMEISIQSLKYTFLTGCLLIAVGGSRRPAYSVGCAMYVQMNISRADDGNVLNTQHSATHYPNCSEYSTMLDLINLTSYGLRRDTLSHGPFL